MISRIHQRLGTAGLIISIVALVAALSGGAYAASGGLTGKQKTEVEKIAKKYAGKNGKKGPAGPQGPAGVAGPAGSKGDKGDPGSSGSNGTNGTNGESVKIESYTGEECEFAENEAGAKFTNATGTAYACNGGSGSSGSAGLPKTLGPEETETGTWASSLFNEEAFVPISFTIPLAAELDSSHVILVGSGTVPTECQFGAAPPSVSHPEAKPGYLCIFKGFFATESETRLSGKLKPDNTGAGASTTGTVLEVFSESGSTNNHGAGTWAVTGALAG